MATASNSFHNLTDQQIHAYQTCVKGKWGGGSYVTLRNRSLTYQFFPHFHPYVVPLVHRLNDGGISELQESDTLYLPLPPPTNGQPLPLNVLPDTTRAILSKTVTAFRPDNSAVSLSAGTPLTLPDNTMVAIAA